MANSYKKNLCLGIFLIRIIQLSLFSGEYLPIYRLYEMYIMEMYSWILDSYVSLRPFHKTLPKSSAFVKWISERFYETDCMSIMPALNSAKVLFVLNILFFKLYIRYN